MNNIKTLISRIPENAGISVLPIAKKENILFDELKTGVSKNVYMKAKRLYSRIQTPEFRGNMDEKLIRFTNE